MYTVANVAVENATPGFDKLYSYLVPEDLACGELCGRRCTVPFGSGNKRRTGIILETAGQPEIDRLKPIVSILDPEPLLEDEGLFLLRYLHDRTFCTWFDALRLLIPAGVGIVYKTVFEACKPFAGTLSEAAKAIYTFLCSKRQPVAEDKLCAQFDLLPASPLLQELLAAGAALKTERMRRRVLDEKQTMVRLVRDTDFVLLTPKQEKVAAFLEQEETVSLKELCYFTGVGRAVVDRLVKTGAAEYYDCVSLRNPYAPAPALEEKPPLTGEQQAVYDALQTAYDAGDRKPVLLHGVTGSGKTQVFLKLIEHMLSLGKTAIVLVPEISLTAQAVESFHRRFGSRVAVLHSGLSLGERMDEWRRLKQGGADVAIGTRSAIFAPLKNIGLIVIDEEQEHTYKSDKSPRYHARDIAAVRCKYHQAALLLCSATPSVESYHAAKTGAYTLLTLTQRFNQQLLPDVYTVDMRDAVNNSAYPSLSATLLEELLYNLNHGEQSILLLNRRGYSTLVKCSGCGTVADCPNCSVSMTYHSANDSLLCHYCGYSREKATTCEHCGSGLIRYAGAGTQKLQEDLQALFPAARILRVDMDTTMSKFAHEKLFASFAAGEYDIMLGTQMVAKGLNFPNVTLVGVLQADQSLYAGDFRSFERTFSLLTQVIGRSGRGQKRGRAYVQTYSPENPIIRLAAIQDYPAFFAPEIKLRKLHLYPPFCVLCGIGFVGESLEETRAAAEKFTAEFMRVAKESFADLPVRALGPSPADLVKAAGKYRYKLVLKCKNSPQMRRMLWQLLGWHYKECKKIGIFVDMHYNE